MLIVTGKRIAASEPVPGWIAWVSVWVLEVRLYAFARDCISRYRRKVRSLIGLPSAPPPRSQAA